MYQNVITEIINKKSLNEGDMIIFIQVVMKQM